MAQTRRDYIQTTEILHKFIVRNKLPVAQINRLLADFADMFEQNNPTGFNRHVFINNCWNGVDPEARVQRRIESDRHPGSFFDNSNKKEHGDWYA